MTEFSPFLYVRIVNPGTEDVYALTGESPEDVTADLVGEGESVSPDVARYMLVGTGTVHYQAPTYVELVKAP